MSAEQRLTKIEEAMLVQARIMDRLERRHDETIQRHDEEIAELRRSQIELHEVQKKTEQSLQAMNAGMNALFEHMDRFIRGLESNGHK